MENSSPNTQLPFSFKQLRRGVQSYTVTMLLQPWIWVWGYITLSLLLIAMVNWRTGSSIMTINTQTERTVNTFYVWIFALISIWFNYTVSYVLRYKYPRLGIVLFLLSLSSLLIMLILIWPLFTVLL